MSQSAKEALWAAVVPAAGAGARMKGKGPKQFLCLGHRAVLVHTLQALAACPRLAGLVVVTPEDVVSAVVKMIGSYGVGKVQAVVPGGPAEKYPSVPETWQEKQPSSRTRSSSAIRPPSAGL